jgi:hypothetical protein
VRKRYLGELEGTSVAEVLTAQGPDGQAFVAIERVDGRLAGRAGTFVLQHGGLIGEGEPRAFGHVVPGSGTGELHGLRGEAAFAHDEAGARVVLTLLG